MLLLSLFFLMPFVPANASFPSDEESKRSKEQVEQSLIGTWVMKPSNKDYVLRYVRSDEFRHNTRGFKFHASGKVTIYAEFASWERFTP